MGAGFLDEKGNQRTITMGCYGIGINRIVAAMIETSYDEKGIIWKMGIAPYHVGIVAVDMRDEEVRRVAESVHDGLEAAGVEVLYDDREATPGVKFNDADLIGLPLRVTVGRRALDKGGVELKWRHKKEFEILPLDSAAATIAELVESALAESELPPAQ
jgi:prolyl-tRNA synthetase